MKSYTEKEIKDKVEFLWGDSYRCVEIEINIKPSSVDITLSCMYESPGLTFAQLKALSEFFETENLNDIDNFAYGGCETCDYGSKYGFTLTIK